MTPDAVMTLAGAFLRATLLVCSPILVTSLVAGVFVGIVQTATQVNEASVSFVVKAMAVVAVVAAVGPAIAAEAVSYTRHSFEAIGTVVR
ncbi:MAG: flagellar biosynthetic protein FliQ [Polyangiaceae bacterium]